MLIVDDHSLIAQGLALALRLEGFEVDVLTPQSGAEVPAAAAASTPDVVVLDLDLGPTAGSSLPLIKPLRDQGTSVIVLTGAIDPAILGLCAEAGANGIVTKAQPFDAFLVALRKVLRGEPGFRAGDREELLSTLRTSRTDQRDRMRPFASLSRRESEVLVELIRGRSAGAIAEGSFVGLPTVRTQIRGILMKLGVTSQLAAVGLARSVDWQFDAGSTSVTD